MRVEMKWIWNYVEVARRVNSELKIHYVRSHIAEMLRNVDEHLSRKASEVMTEADADEVLEEIARRLF